MWSPLDAFVDGLMQAALERAAAVQAAVTGAAARHAEPAITCVYSVMFALSKALAHLHARRCREPATEPAETSSEHVR